MTWIWAITVAQLGLHPLSLGINHALGTITQISLGVYGTELRSHACTYPHSALGSLIGLQESGLGDS